MAQADTKPDPMDDSEILTRVEQKVRLAIGYFDSKLSKERERCINYYNLLLPKRQNEGRSSFMSSDVYDGVESMKAQLLETFSGNPDNLVSFPPRHPQDMQSSLAATEYCNHAIHELNHGFNVFHDAIHDGLMCRVGVTKVYWDNRHEDVEENFEGLSELDVHALAAQETIVHMEAEEDVQGSGRFRGILLRREDNSQIVIEPVPPEEFLIEQRSYVIPTGSNRAGMCCHRTLKTRAELKREGYDPIVVDTINWSDARSLDLTGEQISRNYPVNDGTAPIDDAVQPELQKVMLYETYIRMDQRNGKGAKLYKILHAGNILLDNEEVDRAPFIAFHPLRVSHIFHGNNFAYRCVPYQNARTVLTRAILDHASITTNPRWGVVKGGLLNPKEMLDNRLGGIVNLNRPDAVQALQQQPLNPFVFQTLEMLKQNKEETTSISSLSQGLDKNAISTQNSSALVDNLVSLSGQRQKIIARNFATYVVDLYLEVYRLALLNEKKVRMIQIANNFVPVKVEDWDERLTCRVALHLGYGERDQQAAKINGAYTQMAQDQGLSNLMTDQNRYNMVTDAMKAGRLENWANYLTPPAPDPQQQQFAPPKQPDPMKVQELQTKGKVADASMVTAQANALKNERQATIQSMKEQIAELRMHITALMDERESRRMDAETANRINISQREMTLAEKYPPTQTSASIVPRG
jgi:hypothetical protein